MNNALNKIMSKHETTAHTLQRHKNFVTCYDELHTRPFPQINGPVNISSIAIIHEQCALNEQSIRDEIAHITKLCQDNNRQEPAMDCRHFYQSFDNFEFRWERHNEFSSYTFIVRANNHSFFSNPAINQVCKTWLATIAGKVISALHIEAKTAVDLQRNAQEIKPYFEQYRLLGSMLHLKKISLWSAMRLHQDGFNRILLLSEDIHQCQNGRIIRTLLELEVYRNLTLLALPLAQQIVNEVNAIEVKLTGLLQHNSAEKHNEQQLAALSTLRAKLAILNVKSQYRFDASIAYYQIVDSRLTELHEEKVANLQTVTAFIKRRLLPALRTIKVAKYRLDDLATRIDRASDFLRTQIDMAITQQNQALLTSMNNRAQIQLNLQQTVEGLSVIVVTYYLLALTRYALEAINNAFIQVNQSQVIACLLPLYLLMVWLFGKRIKKHIANK